MKYALKNPRSWFDNSYSPRSSDKNDAIAQVHNPFYYALSTLLPEFVAPMDVPRSKFQPRLDLTGDEKNYFVSVELPGVDPADITVELNEGQLIIQGEKKNDFKEEDKETGYYRLERNYGSFRRIIALPDDALEDKISASNKNGVLAISIPRRQKQEVTSRKIAIINEGTHSK